MTACIYRLAWEAAVRHEEDLKAINADKTDLRAAHAQVMYTYAHWYENSVEAEDERTRRAALAAANPARKS